MIDCPEAIAWYRAKQNLKDHDRAAEEAFWDAGEKLAQAIERRIKLSQAFREGE